MTTFAAPPDTAPLHLPPDELLSALEWRYATKKYDPARDIPDDVWAALEQTLVLTPSSYGIQPWRFLVVDDPALRAKLVPAAYGQAQVAEASRLVVFTVRRDLGQEHLDRYLARTAEVRGTNVAALTGFRDLLAGAVARAKAAGRLDEWSTRQVYIALGQFLAAAALLGVDATPMEGLEPARFDDVLGLTGTTWTTVCAVAVGYRAADDRYATAPKVRFPLDEVVHHV